MSLHYLFLADTILIASRVCRTCITASSNKRLSRIENISHLSRTHHIPHVGPACKSQGRWEGVHTYQTSGLESVSIKYFLSDLVPSPSVISFVSYACHTYVSASFINKPIKNTLSTTRSCKPRC